MSGITPILDTLLHQVLGKRVDTPPVRELTAPVQPPLSAEAARAVHSDSRLDARAGGGAEAVAALARQPHSPFPTAAPQGDVAPDGASTSTRLSPTARLIGDLLAQFPAPNLAIRPARPLLVPAGAEGDGDSGAGGDAARVATALRESIGSSGLFYESHLARWLRGEMSRQRLMAEPQMRFHIADAAAPTAAPRPAVEVAEGLQGIVRHQLEVLASPVLRWEGDLWSGIAVALLIQSQEGAQRESGETGAEEGEKGDCGDEWCSELTIGLEQLGAIRVRLHLRGETLRVAIEAATAAAETQLRQGREALLERLSGGGFVAPEVSIASTGAGTEEQRNER